MDISNFLFGSSPEMKQLSTMSPEQMQQFQQFLSGLGGLGNLDQQAMGQLGDWLDPSSASYQRMAEPYMRQFNQQTVPGLAERFAGAGAMGGGLSSSGFGQALSSAGANLQSDLAQMKTGLQRQALGDIMNQYSSRSGQAQSVKPFGYAYQPGGTGLIGQMASGLAQSGFPGASNLWSMITGKGGF